MDTNPVNSTAQAYQNVTDTYERGRPEYTKESVQFLLKELHVERNSRVLDLGAGTGKFTKHLAPSCEQPMAVEPVSNMRERLASNLPGVIVSDGHAEAIPYADEFLDTVIVANAFHWFNAPKALKEIHRALRPGGGLGLIWLNDGVFTSDWGKKIDEMLLPYEDSAPQRKTGLWRQAFLETELFTSLNEANLRHTRETTPDLVIDRVTSLSFIAVLPEVEKDLFVGKIKSLLASHPQTAGRSLLQVDCDTDLYWCFKK